MTWSQATVTHTFTNADATPASGSVQFSLEGIMTNGASSLVPSSVTANLSSGGALSQALISNIDPGTVPAAPQNTQWRVDLRILGAPEQTFYIVVPSGGGTVDLFSLIPNQQQVA